ncbi:MAG: hypothetical protein ABW116_01500 [Candidatus Sedimenticola sp. 20ELBAFRAG]
MKIEIKGLALLFGAALLTALVSGCNADSTTEQVSVDTSVENSAIAAEDPFDKSHKACMSYGECMSVSTPGLTLRQVLEVFKFTPQSVLNINGWDENMLDREVPVNKKFMVMR